MSKKKPKPIEYPLEVPITPRLLAAVDAAIGRKIPPGARVMIVAPPAPACTIPHFWTTTRKPTA